MLAHRLRRRPTLAQRLVFAGMYVNVELSVRLGLGRGHTIICAVR